jgi:hypothetical protein
VVTRRRKRRRRWGMKVTVVTWYPEVEHKIAAQSIIFIN